ncbi:unnamed protein product [Mesocestoides corti]|uniref:Secreted protein n=1 Tax=Mesocestoides corti TaxID=53468 RepID=A0A0R3U8I4_MESCO|nr:unnamed protein product [Mesocestoides corti]
MWSRLLLTLTGNSCSNPPLPGLSWCGFSTPNPAKLPNAAAFFHTIPLSPRLILLRGGHSASVSPGVVRGTVREPFCVPEASTLVTDLHDFAGTL